MVNALVAGREIDRLMGLDCFVPADKREFAIKELLRAMMAAADQTVAIAVTNEWLATQREWPKPADLRRLIWEENEKRDKQLASEQPARLEASHCPKCKGFGIKESIHAGDLRSIASWCECAAGERRERSSCTCPVKDADTAPMCSRPLSQADCCVPPWAVNVARQKLLKIQAREPRKQPPQGLHHIGEDYHGDF